MASSSSPLLAFLFQSLDAVGRESTIDPPPPSGYAQRLAQKLTSPYFERARDTLLIASALPMPTVSHQCQRTAELALLTIASHSLWPKRSFPQSEQTPEHASYWESCEGFLGRVFALPGINPLSTLHATLLRRLSARKEPLCLVAAHMGRFELLKLAVDTLPPEWIEETVKICASFGQFDLAEKLIARSPPSDQVKLEAVLWNSVALPHLTNAPRLPLSSPPETWWNRALHNFPDLAPVNRLLNERPALRWKLTNAFLRSSNADHLAHGAMMGNYSDRALWLNGESKEIPAVALIMSAWLHNNEGAIPEPRKRHDLSQRIDLLLRHLTPEIKQTQEHKDAMVIACLLTSSRTPHQLMDGNAMEEVKSVALRWSDGSAPTQGGMPSVRMLTYAAWGAALLDEKNGSFVKPVDAFLDFTLPYLRDIGRHYQPENVEKAKIYTQFAVLWSTAPSKDHNEVVFDNAAALLEASLWRAAFLREKDRSPPRKSFPSSTGSAKEPWSIALSLVQSGVVPAWTNEEARALFALVQHDAKLPPALRMLIEAESLRHGAPLSAMRPRRI